MIVERIGEKTPDELGLIVCRRGDPFLPATVDRILTIPGIQGAYDFGADRGPLPLPIQCAFNARNRGELQRMATDLAVHLTDGNGRPRTMPLIFDVNPDRQYTVRVSGALQPERIAAVGIFTIPFIAYDPFSYSTFESTDITVDTDMSVDSDMSVDAEYDFALSGPGSLAIDNYGNQNIRPVIEITGSFSSLTLTMGGVTTTYAAPMTGHLVLDFALRTAKIGTANVLGNTNGMFGQLPVGLSTIGVGGSGINCSIAVRFKGKYV